MSSIVQYQAIIGAPPFPPNGPNGGGMPPFPPRGNFGPPGGSPPPGQGDGPNGVPGGIHPDRLRMMASGR
jgi:U1 small nuclear ribonucleoprotein C